MSPTSIEYTIRKSRRSRSLRVSVYQDGRCVVSAPAYMPDFAIKTFVSAKSQWISDKLQSFMPFTPMPVAPAVRRKNSRAEYLKHKEAARELVLRRLPELNAIYGFKYGKIAIRNQKSRWGSCSTGGNLNFNYKIALLPPDLADYLMVHELCHLGEFNHSAKFWNLVARAIPDYKERRAQLHSVKL
ncbi:MAG TPA: M48 family metallopeptidase [Candidatus Paceibacterota bacterium]